MGITRRNFLKLSGVSALALATGLGFDPDVVKAEGDTLKLDGSTKLPSICHFCASGCGLLLHVKNQEFVYLEGDPDNPINEGALCPKAASLRHVAYAKERIVKPMRRAPGSDHWEDITWEEAISKVAKKFKEVRDATWKATEEYIDAGGNKLTAQVNRAEGIAILGCAEVDNEESYLISKFSRILGVPYNEHQARICHAPSVAALMPPFGRGAMTNSHPDMQHTKVFLIGGSNCAEAHPVTMKWVSRAKAKGAKVIVVDPRFTRTASQADVFAQIRPGTDIAYLGAMVKYIIDNKLYDENFLVKHTNALYKINKDYKFTDGIFSGFNEQTKKFNMDTWTYQLDEKNAPILAASLDDPDSVFSKMKELYAPYTFEMAANITGIPAEKIKEISDLFAKTKPGSILYALGMTQHTTGVQGIRAYSVIQLLLGNVGKAGAGIQALRGEPNVQGSTDMANLFHNQPGYIPAPVHTDSDLNHYLARNGSAQQKPIVAQLKAWFGKNATADNDYCFNYLPKYNANQNFYFTRLWELMAGGQFKFLLNIGSNSLVSTANRQLVRQALPKLEMLVVSDLFEIETAQFWREPGVKPADIQTEVIFFPAAFVYEKDGSLTNTGRWIQWKNAAIAPKGEAKPDLDLLDHLFKEIRELYSSSTDPKDAPILDANWDYGDVPSALKVLEELGGYDVNTGKKITIGEYLNAPVGTVATGCWVYAGVTSDGNLAGRRDNSDPSGLGLFPKWSYSWPGNIRILYNRASCDNDGNPLDPDKKLIWWDAAKGTWTGNDNPDLADKTKGPGTPAGDHAFRMNPEGVGRIFTAKYMSDVPTQADANGLKIGNRNASTCADGPLPAFYEPTESPLTNPLYPKHSTNPAAIVLSAYPEIEKHGTAADFPYILTTYSVVEQFCAGGITRNIPVLNELMPEPFAEISKALAQKIGVNNGELIELSSARGKIQVKCMVTDRLQTYKVNGKDTETIGMPYCWGFASLSPGVSVNDLTVAALDPGAGTPETKVCLVNARRA